jgi:hypothetical protein
MTKLEEWLQKTRVLLGRDSIDDKQPMPSVLLWNRLGCIAVNGQDKNLSVEERDKRIHNYAYEVMENDKAMRDIVTTSFRVIEHLKAALEKCENPTLIGHKEPDDYTRIGCISHVAGEALAIDPLLPEAPKKREIEGMSEDVLPLYMTKKALTLYDEIADAIYGFDKAMELKCLNIMEKMSEMVAMAFYIDTIDRNNIKTCLQTIKPGPKIPAEGQELSFVRRQLLLSQEKYRL